MIEAALREVVRLLAAGPDGAADAMQRVEAAVAAHAASGHPLTADELSRLHALVAEAGALAQGRRDALADQLDTAGRSRRAGALYQAP